MFVIYHDYEHHAILNKSIAAKVIMSVFGVYVMAPESIWKRSHDYHHKHNSKLFSSSIGSYQIITKDKFQSLTGKEKFVYLASRHPVTILFGYLSMFMLGMSLSSYISNPRKHSDSLLALILHLVISILVIFFLGWVVWLLSVIIPLFIACGMGAYLFYAQHNFPEVTFSDSPDWSYETAAMESSSFMVMSPIMNWFTANIGYHHIHHLNARIPFYRLPEVMRNIPELQKVKKTSLSLHDVWSCLKLKVWDSEQGKMVGLKSVYN
jgi:omega-6 fatty acid desaturase (delta-12 desaturase)